MLLEPMIALVIPELIIIGVILMIIGYILWKYVAERIVHILGLILLLIGAVVFIIGILQLI